MWWLNSWPSMLIPAPVLWHTSLASSMASRPDGTSAPSKVPELRPLVPEEPVAPEAQLPVVLPAVPLDHQLLPEEGKRLGYLHPSLRHPLMK